MEIASIEPTQGDLALIIHARGVNRTRFQWVARKDIPSLFLRYADVVLLPGFFLDVAERRLERLEGAQLFELLLHTAGALHREFEQSPRLFLGNLAVGVDQL